MSSNPWDKLKKGGKASKVDQVKKQLNSELNVLNAADVDLDDIPTDITPDERFEDGFTTGKHTRVVTQGRIISHSGQTFVGKTFSMLSQIKQNPKGIVEEVDTWNLKGKDREIVIEAMIQALKEKRYHTVNELFCFGTELSVEETLNSEDNVDFFDGWYEKIHYQEIYKKTTDRDELNVGVDGPQSVRLLTRKLILLERELMDENAALEKLNRSVSLAVRKSKELNPKDLVAVQSLDERIKKANAEIARISSKKDRALGFDSQTSVLFWHNETIRRKLVGRRVFSQEQQVPAPFWFWRNTKMEGLSLDLRLFNIQAWQTWKMARDKEGNVLDDKPRWHDDTSGHLSSIHVHSFKTEGGELACEFKKCRPRRALCGRFFPFITANLLLALCLGLEDHLGDRIKFRGSVEKMESAADARDDDLIIDEKGK
jgi:hypothetical protein